LSGGAFSSIQPKVLQPFKINSAQAPLGSKDIRVADTPVRPNFTHASSTEPAKTQTSESFFVQKSAAATPANMLTPIQPVVNPLRTAMPKVFSDKLLELNTKTMDVLETTKHNK
jgi:hypothetical protein